jgi:hypothetical protein
MSGLDQAARHGKAHLTQADESDFHVMYPSAYPRASLRGALATKQSIFLCVATWIASLRSQ